MKMTPRRRRSDSSAAAVAASQAVALGPLQPPAHVRLREGDRPFWDAIVQARARDTWTEPDLASAAAMARAQADIERLQATIDAEGEFVTLGNGSPAPTNLDVPPHRYAENVVIVGEDTKGA